MNPITALVPVRNGEKYLPVFLQSITGICADEDEILFINDGSSDKTEEILNDFCKQSESRRVLTSPSQGLVNALNFGFTMARNEWVARFDVDDVYERYRLSCQRTLIDESVSAIFCDYDFEGMNGEPLGTVRSGIFNEATAISLFNNWRTPHPGVLINKKYFFAVNGYALDEYPAEDLGLWLRIKDVGKLVSFPSVLFRYRLHPNSVTAQNRELMLAKKAKLLDEHKNLEKLVKDFETHLWNMYNIYEKYPDSIDRRILLLYDYYSALRKNSISVVRNRVLVLLILRVIFNPKMVHGVFKLTYFKFKRDQYRKFHSCKEAPR